MFNFTQLKSLENNLQIWGTLQYFKRKIRNEVGLGERGGE